MKVKDSVKHTGRIGAAVKIATNTTKKEGFVEGMRKGTEFLNRSSGKRVARKRLTPAQRKKAAENKRNNTEGGDLNDSGMTPYAAKSSTTSTKSPRTASRSERNKTSTKTGGGVGNTTRTKGNRIVRPGRSGGNVSDEGHQNRASGIRNAMKRKRIANRRKTAAGR